MAHLIQWEEDVFASCLGYIIHEFLAMEEYRFEPTPDGLISRMRLALCSRRRAGTFIGQVGGHPIYLFVHVGAAQVIYLRWHRDADLQLALAHAPPDWPPSPSTSDDDYEYDEMGEYEDEEEGHNDSDDD